ncbi:putative porin [Hymenobacter latericus]|uniref:putative porin n=1 Tax=Hymenobacter sp. YIM 151858-1 TaxID=2987688 RepID=UPI0022276428|nr:putative porin [Hymenobacter sp. YIM 151858-1]UYZ59973.1 putative porin [Hymenobacter sp. YIM 151858-1]
MSLPPDVSALCQTLRLGRASRLLLWLLLLLPLVSRAQVVDDSTRVLYGPRTTLVVREENLLRNQPEGSVLDTTLTGIQNNRNWYYDSTFQQDLGNVGTASRRLLWETNTNIGIRYGRTAFDKYFRNSANIPYYDTRSPYTYFRFVQGAQGEQVFEGSYSRSIKKAVNLGIAYERFSANKQLGAVSTREGQVTHTGVLVFARYQTKNDRYHLLTNYYTAKHRAAEQGGIRPGLNAAGERDSLEQLFDYEQETVWLTQAINKDHRDRFHLAHTYNLVGRGLTAFHVFDWSRQYNRYTDDRLTFEQGRLLFYPEALRDSARTDDVSLYRQLENTFGFLGRTKLLEYRVYGRQRTGRYTMESLTARPAPERKVPTVQADTTQIFVGGNAAFRWKIFQVLLAGEYKFIDEAWARGSLRLGPLSGELLYSSFAPTLTQQRYSGNHHRWATDFDNTNITQFTVAFDQRIGAPTARLQQRVQASGRLVNINSLVYYGLDPAARNRQDLIPQQLTGANANQRLLIGTLRHQLRYGVLRLDNLVTFTEGGDQQGLSIPQVVGNSRILAEGFLFQKALFSQVGVEAFYQSSYKPYDYSPATQQFFVQNYFTSRGYPVVDVFVTADIKTVSVFLKMAYINQNLDGNAGYFPTPYYTGIPRSFQVGLKWNFFD